MSSSGPVSIADKFYPDTISLQPGSNVSYEIKGLYSTLTAQVGVGSESAGEESIEFVAAGDGKEIWRSGKMTKADGARSAKIDVTGIQRLVLRIEGGATPGDEIDRGEARRHIQAAWIEAVLSKED